MLLHYCYFGREYCGIWLCTLLGHVFSGITFITSVQSVFNVFVSYIYIQGSHASWKVLDFFSLTLSGRSAGYPAVHLCTSGRSAVYPAECRLWRTNITYLLTRPERVKIPGPGKSWKITWKITYFLLVLMENKQCI